MQNNKLGKAFWVIWTIEFWERFGYAGVQAVLMAYLTEKLGFSDKSGSIIFGSYAAFSYGLLFIGGYIGDKILGPQRTIVLGAIVLMLSYVSLAIADQSLVFYSLAGIIIGNALFKANPTSLISKIFDKESQQMSIAMTIYYLAINIGALISMFLVPLFSSKFGLSVGFVICAVGLFFGILSFCLYYPTVASITPQKSIKLYTWNKVIILSAVAIYLIGQMLSNNFLSSVISYSCVIIGFAYFIYIATKIESATEKKKMYVALILVIQAVIFYTLYFQMPTSITLFAKYHVDRNIFGFLIPYSSFQLLNPLFIVILSPLIIFIFKNIDTTHATKFNIGMSLCAIAFFVLFASKYSANTTGHVNMLWLVLSYAVQACGEVFISAIGLAMITQLTPSNMSGVATGIWFLSSMFGGKLAGTVASLSSLPEGSKIDNNLSLNLYTNNFLHISIVVIVVAAIFWLLSPKLNKILRS